MTSVLLLGLLQVLTLLFQSPQVRPDFSGYWQLDKSRSQVAATTSTMWMRVEQSGNTVLLNLRAFAEKGGEENQTFVYAIGGTENHNTMHGAPMKSSVHWSDNALEFQSVAMFGSNALRMTDRWELSSEASLLTFTEVSQFAQEPERTAVRVFTRRQAKDWPEDTSSQPVEKQFRNIQVLTGKPSSQLPIIMAGFARSLGVTCAQCHVVGQFELDERPDKQIARQMFAMTTKMNAENFSTATPVTCWTCHRGALVPENAPK